MAEQIDVVRAWKDEGYRQGLSAEARRSLAPPPENMEELSDEELRAVAGGPGWTGPLSVAGLATGVVSTGAALVLDKVDDNTGPSQVGQGNN